MRFFGIKRINLTILLLMASLMVQMSAAAAEPCKFQVELDFSLSAGFHQRYKTMEDSPVADYEAYAGFLTHVSLLYNINRKFTTGIGVGLDNYSLAPNAVPVFATFRHRPIQKPILENFYYFTNLGYSLPFVDSKTFAAGWLFDVGIGWQKNFRKHFGLDVHLGYGLKEFRTHYGYANSPIGTVTFRVPEKYSIVRNSIVLGIGIVI